MTPSTPTAKTSDADRARADAHTARRAADHGRAATNRARFANADARTLREGVRIVGALLASPADMGVYTPDNALHNDDGSVNTMLVVECLAALDQGHGVWEILETLNQRREDARVYGPVDVHAQQLYALADAMQARAEHPPVPVQPALPPTHPEPTKGQAALTTAEGFVNAANEELKKLPVRHAPEPHGLPGVPKAPPPVAGGPEDTSAMLHRIDPNLSDAEIDKLVMHRPGTADGMVPPGLADTITMAPVPALPDVRHANGIADQGPRTASAPHPKAGKPGLKARLVAAAAGSGSGGAND